MLADQFHQAAADARSYSQLEEIGRLTWRAHAEGHLADADAQAVAEALQGRRASLGAANPSRQRASRPGRREKLFGVGRPRPLDRNAKARIMHLARALSHRTEPGRHYGQITAKALAVLEALLWGFHNARSGLCFPSYEKIAEAARCARSTVYEAIAALEAAGLMTWVNRIKRVRENIPGLPGVGATRLRVIRTSNAYAFTDPLLANSSKSELPSRTANQDSIPLHERAAATAKRRADGLAGSPSRLHDEVGDRQQNILSTQSTMPLPQA